MKLINLYRVTLIGLLVCTLSAYGQQRSNNVEKRVDDILSQMTFADKLSYIGGTGFFDVKPIPGVNLPLNPQLFQTDAGLGVRVTPASVRYPAGPVLAATWNPDRARDLGAGLGRDTRARGFFTILGPGMDFYRTPFGGRNFEYATGEDPFLGSQLVPEAIKKIQEQGVWACAKHYVCNDQEANRTNINTIIDERTLREIYLPPFEAAVKEGHTATVMGAYNFVQIGTLPSEQCNEGASEDPKDPTSRSFLLDRVLKTEWGFKGFVMSDYLAIHNGVKAYLGGCDLELPASNLMSSPKVGGLILNGTLPESILEDKVRRILREVVSFGFLDRQQLDSSIPLDDPRSELAALDTAREGIVLLKNENNLLPLKKHQVRSIAVIGPAALGAPPTGFGSSFVTPISFVSELEGIQDEAPARTEVDLIPQCTLDPSETPWQFINANGQIIQGLQGQYFTTPDLSGTPAVTRIDNEIDFDWEQGQIPVSQNQTTFSAKWTGQIVAQVSGDQVFKVCADGGVRLIVNGQTLIDNFNSPPLPPLGFGPTVAFSAKFPAVAGNVYSVELDYHRVPGFFGSAFVKPGGGVGGLLGVQLSWASLQPPSNFAKYNAVVVCVGTDNKYEGEGYDRPYQLPEFQDELIQNVSNVKLGQTIVVTHGGGSFDVQPWIDQIGALLHASYPGQNGGQALAEILFGTVNPSGKLPFTWEKRITDNPAFATFPMPLNQKPPSPNPTTTIQYTEGIFVGYRGYEIKNIEPQFPFGFGLSYTTFAYSDLDIEPAEKENDREKRGDREEHGLTKAEFKEHDGDDHGLVRVSFTVTNTGKRAGAEIAELYVGEKNPTVPRPIKELKGFKKVFLQPGDSRRVTLDLDQRSFAFFDSGRRLWVAKPDIYNILVGASSQDIRLNGQFKLQSELTSKP
jgi:beta-glucosidase